MSPVTIPCMNCKKAINEHTMYTNCRYPVCSEECANVMFTKEQLINTIPIVNSLWNKNVLMHMSLDDLKEIRAKFGEFAVLLENKIAKIQS